MTYPLEAENLQKAAFGLANPTESEKASHSLLSELGTSASNQGKSIYNGVAQIADGFGLNIPMAKLQTQTQAPLMSARWWMQQGGSLAVTVPLIVLTHRGVTALTEGFAADAAARTVSSEVATKAFAFTPDKMALGRLTATGAIYEGLFKPSTDKSLPWGRLKQAGEGGLGFLGAGLVSSKISGALARGAAERELPLSLSSKVLNVALPGMGAGAVYGALHEQSKSILDTFKPAGFYKTINASASGAILGTALSTAGMLQTADAAQIASARESASAAESARPVGKVAEGTRALADNSANDVLSTLKRQSDVSPADREQSLSQANRDILAATRYARNGQHQEAAQTWYNALQGLVKAHGTEHPTVADALANMARSDMFSGNSGRSVSALQSAVRINKANFGESSPQVADNYEQLSAVYQRSGNYKQAADALDNSVTARRAAEGAAKSTGADRGAEQGSGNGSIQLDPGLRDVLSRLAGLYEKAGDPVKANQVRESIPPKPFVEPDVR